MIELCPGLAGCKEGRGRHTQTEFARNKANGIPEKESSGCGGPEAACVTPLGLSFAALSLHMLSLCLDYGSRVMEKHTKHTRQGMEASRFKMDWGVRLRREVQIISLLLWVKEGRVGGARGPVRRRLQQKGSGSRQPVDTVAFGSRVT